MSKMSGVQIKISRELTFIAIGNWVNKGSLYSFLNFCIYLKFFKKNKKLLKKSQEEHRYNLKTKLVFFTLYSLTRYRRI